jgi:hypothetical protein
VVGCCECGDEPSGSCATELVSYSINYKDEDQLHLLKQSVRERGGWNPILRPVAHLCAVQRGTLGLYQHIVIISLVN